MELDIEHIYDRMPDEMQSAARKWYYVLDPRRSWSERTKPDRTHREFVDRFFDGESEFEAYRSEFFESPVPDAIVDAVEGAPDGYGVYDAHRDECVKFYALVRKLQPDSVVETGVYNGVSTASILAALDRNGHGRLHSIDRSERISRERRNENGEPPIDRTSTDHLTRDRPSCAEPNGYILPPGKSPGWIVPEGIRDRWSLTRGRSQKKLSEVLADVGTVDIFLHDSEHSTACMLYEFESAWTSLTTGGLILSSHIDWNDAFETFVRERQCEHGLVSFHYLGYRDHESQLPCSTGFIRNPDGQS